MKHSQLPQEIINKIKRGVVIPALPLALDKNRKLDPQKQRALMRYYLSAGAGGVAVAVHTTQFEIRGPKVNLYENLLEIAGEEFDTFNRTTQQQVVRIAGVIGKTIQASKEAKLALKNRYHAVLLSLAAFSDASNNEIIEHCKAVAEIIPLVGFYLQPAVGVNWMWISGGNLRKSRM